jgi:hypothetical protein
MPIHGSQPRLAKLTDSSYTWANGTTFTGFVRLGLIVSKYGGTVDAPEITLATQSPAQPLPLNTVIQITNGKADSQARVFYNADLRPPNSQYVAWWYDSTGTLIAGPSVQFTVSTDPFSPPTPTLTTPSVGDEIPPSN